MLAKRIIPCLDIKDGQTVKGTNFVNLRQAGDPVELARAYSEQGADELVFLDITASFEGRKTFAELVKRIAANISIPFTVGGGIHELSDVDRLLSAGADKISINSSAIKHPQLIDEIAKNFGSQVCVLAVDAKQTIASVVQRNDMIAAVCANLHNIAQLCSDHGKLIAGNHITLIVNYANLTVGCILHLINNTLEHSIRHIFSSHLHYGSISYFLRNLLYNVFVEISIFFYSNFVNFLIFIVL